MHAYFEHSLTVSQVYLIPQSQYFTKAASISSSMAALSFIAFIVGIAAINGAVSPKELMRRQVDAQEEASVDQSTSNGFQKLIKRHAGQSNGSAFPIDVVYCWSGQPLQNRGDGDHNTGGGFGELRYSIRFLEAYAPWFNKAYILVNTPSMERPPWLSEASQDRIVMVDRCSLFTRSQDCPTEDTAACQSVMHKIPGLSEHYLQMDDDFLMLKPLTPTDFFSSESPNNPFVLPAQAEIDYPMYDDTPQGPDMPPESTPTRMGAFHHLPIPNLVSFVSQLEDKYPDWYAFVRSHHTRFVCCDASVRGNGLDELFHRIYPHMLLKLGVGIQQPGAPATICDSALQGEGQRGQEQCFEGHLKDPQLKFMTLQNIGVMSTWRVVVKALEEHVKNMPASTLVVRDP